MNNNLNKVMLPALRAKMGDWIYYITFMKMSTIASRVSVAKEIHHNKSLNELIQRELTNRSKQIKEYLIQQKQRFFNSLIVGVYDGHPKWHEMAIKSITPNSAPIPPHIEQSLGLLELEGSEKLFAVDGQHRVEAIRQAVGENSDLGDEEVAVIMVSHKNNKEGLKRTRRLFSTLNRYAKPVSSGEIIALDEDDVLAITTRQLIENHSLLSKESIILAGKTKQIPKSNKKCLTSILTLYDVLNLVLLIDKEHRPFRPNDEKLKEYYKKACNFWALMVKYFKPLNELSSSKNLDKIVCKYRHSNGGNMLFRPVGLLSISLAVKFAGSIGWSQEKIIKYISKMPLEISQTPWAGLLWNSTEQLMINRKRNYKIAAYLLLYMAGINLKQFKKYSFERLKKEYAGALNKPEGEVELPLKVSFKA